MIKDDDQPMDAELQRASDFRSISSGLSGALGSFAISALRRKQLSVALILFLVLNIADQLTKQFARTNLAAFQELSYLGGFIRVRHSENPGAFLSLGAQLGEHLRFGLFTVLVVAFLIWATWMMIRKAGFANMSFIVGWSMLIAGGFGNLIDRVMKSTVTDFLIFGAGPLQTGVLNIADMAITFGILIVIFMGREAAHTQF